MKKIYLVVLSMLLFSGVTFSQEKAEKFSVAGGPMIGFYINSVTDLNSELVKAGFPKISENGYLTIGGGGFIELPQLPGLRIGGYGFGFSERKSETVLNPGNNLIKSVKYSYSGGGITIEYTKSLGSGFEFTAGGAIGIGSLNVNLYKHSNDLRNWIIYGGDTVSAANELQYSSQTYSFEPRIGIGYQLTNYLNLKLNAGYTFSVQNTWKLDDVLEVENVPSGIKAQGFNINLTLNAGIFIK